MFDSSYNVSRLLRLSRFFNSIVSTKGMLEDSGGGGNPQWLPNASRVRTGEFGGEGFDTF